MSRAKFSRPTFLKSSAYSSSATLPLSTSQLPFMVRAPSMVVRPSFSIASLVLASSTDDRSALMPEAVASKSKPARFSWRARLASVLSSEKTSLPLELTVIGPVLALS
ncbi:hypothetical protein D3C87_1609190 [compost metagenome]